MNGGSAQISRLPTHLTDRSDEEVKFGLNARMRNRTSEIAHHLSRRRPQFAAHRGCYGNNITFYQGHYANGPQIDAATVRGVYAAALAAGNIITDPVANALNDVSDKENVYAAYGQYQFGFGPARHHCRSADRKNPSHLRWLR